MPTQSHRSHSELNTRKNDLPSPDLANTGNDFQILDFELVGEAKSVRARFDVACGGLLVRGLRIHESRHGAYLGTPGRRATWEPSGWQNAVDVEPALADRILTAALKQLAAAESGIDLGVDAAATHAEGDS